MFRSLDVPKPRQLFKVVDSIPTCRQCGMRTGAMSSAQRLCALQATISSQRRTPRIADVIIRSLIVIQFE